MALEASHAHCERPMSRPAGAPAWWSLKVAAGLVLIGQVVVVLGVGVPVSRLDVPLALGQSIAIAGGAIALVHYAMLRSSSRDISRPAALVTSRGLYRVVRHPMYLGDLVLMVGFALTCATALAVACVLVGAFALVRLARAEDATLLARFEPEF